MATFQLIGIGPNRPADDLTRHSEGGLEAALVAARRLFPDRSATGLGTGTWSRPATNGDDGSEVVLLATYGATTVLLGNTGGLVPTPSEGVYTFARQSVTDSYLVEVDAPPITRLIGLGPGEVGPDEGEPLPFEAPFWAGEHDEYPGEVPAFDTDEWGSAAALWLFGWDPGGGPGPFDAANQPLHTVRLV